MLDVYYIVLPSIALPLAVAGYTFAFVETTKFFPFLMISVCSFLAFLLTLKLIPIFKVFNLKADLFGMDINKKGSEAGEKKMYIVNFLQKQDEKKIFFL